MSIKANLVLITIDSLRADHLSCYGYHRRTSPNIDKIAEEGVLFSNCFATSCQTFYSFISIFLSYYPSMYKPQFSKVIKTLPEILKENGYRTIGIHSNSWLLYGPFHRGFDVYKDLYFDRTGVITSFASPIKSKMTYDILQSIQKYAKKSKILYFISSIPYNIYVLKGNKDKIDDYLLVKEAIRHLNNTDHRPFFLWLHFMNIHYRPNPPSKYFHFITEESYPSLLKKAIIFSKTRHFYLSSKERELVIELYDGAIRYVDTIVGYLIEYFRERKLMNTTYFIITADHGDEFGEHGDYFHHKPKLHNELLHVPLIIRGPDIPRKTVSENVSLIDLAPTILDLLRIPPYRGFLGESLIALIKKNQKFQKPIISEIENKICLLYTSPSPRDRG